MICAHGITFVINYHNTTLSSIILIWLSRKKGGRGSRALKRGALDNFLPPKRGFILVRVRLNRGFTVFHGYISLLHMVFYRQCVSSLICEYHISSTNKVRSIVLQSNRLALALSSYRPALRVERSSCKTFS